MYIVNDDPFENFANSLIKRITIILRLSLSLSEFDV